MANSCAICGKRAGKGNKVAHCNKKAIRRFKPNLQSIRIVRPDGRKGRALVCARCIKSGKVVKAVS